MDVSDGSSGHRRCQYRQYRIESRVSREDYQNQEEEKCESEESDELIDDREYYISGYTKYDVVDENFISIDLSCNNKTNTSNTDLTRQKISLNIGGSQWKFCTELSTYYSKTKISGLEIELEKSAWDDATQYAIEFIIVGRRGYALEPLILKKRIMFDNYYDYDIYSLPRMILLYNINSKTMRADVTLNDISEFNSLSGSLEVDKSSKFGLLFRVLRKRTNREILFEPKSDKVLVVNDRRFPVSTDYLSSFSPVFDAMFHNDMKERDADEIEIKGIESADNFADFLDAISSQRIRPNPGNILAIAELADRYQVKCLMEKCNQQLKDCHDIPIIDRITFADEHMFYNDIIQHLLEKFVPDDLSKFYLDHKVDLDEHPQVVIYLFTRVAQKK